MPDEQRPVISAVIVSYNTRDMTLRCLTALNAELGGMAAEVFVVDNGSTDGSAEATREAFPAVSVIDLGRNAGFGAANNVAFARATGEYALLLNSDAFVRPGAITALVAAAGYDQRLAVIGPRLLNGDGSLQPSCYKFPSPWRALCENTLLTAAFPNHPLLGDFRTWPHNQPREVGFVIGACMLVRRSAIEEVGGFDEGFFLYAEEADWCRRFWKAGWRVLFTPAAEVVHLGGGSGKEQPAKVFCEFHRAQERFQRKHYGLIGLAFFRLTMVAGACLRIALFGIGAVLGRSGRDRSLRQVSRWLRILKWTVGFRGPGLAAY